MHADLECIMFKKMMDAQIILKIYLQQKQANILHQVIQCLQHLRLEA